MNRKAMMLILTAAALTSGVVLAGPFGGDGYGRGPCGAGYAGGRHEGDFAARQERMVERLTARLDLNEEQIASIRDIVSQAHPQMRELHANLRENRRALREAGRGGGAEEEDVQRLADQRRDYRVELAALRTQTRSAINEVLTPGQRQVMETWREQRPGRFSRGL